MYTRWLDECWYVGAQSRNSVCEGEVWSKKAHMGTAVGPGCRVEVSNVQRTSNLVYDVVWTMRSKSQDRERRQMAWLGLGARRPAVVIHARKLGALL